MVEGCVRCVIISPLIREKLKVSVRENNAIIVKKNEYCKGKNSTKRKCILVLFLNIHFYELKLLLKRFFFIDYSASH